MQRYPKVVKGQNGTIECPVSYPEKENVHHSVPYPWLVPDDPRRFQTDNLIVYEKIDLSQ